jgi:hypothetical protein
MQVTATASIFEVIAILVAFIGLVSGLQLRHDARLDVAARQIAGVNHGTADLARLLVVTSTLLSASMLFFLAVATFAAWSPPNARIRPSSYALQVGLVLSEACVAGALWYKQRVRRRVFERDMADQALREAAASTRALAELAANTNALAANTAATEAATEALGGGDDGI